VLIKNGSCKPHIYSIRDDFKGGDNVESNVLSCFLRFEKNSIPFREQRMPEK
jgi:hypothetical protein